MRIVHIISSIAKVNFGVWNAAVFGSDMLKEKYNVESEAWICKQVQDQGIEILSNQTISFFSKKDITKQGLKKWSKQFDTTNTIFVSHGAWLSPTFIGCTLKKMGYKWIYTPHGMLEPQGFNIKKHIYFHLFEKRRFNNCSIIRSVSDIEKKNLRKLSNKEIVVINNGVKIPLFDIDEKPKDIINFLFLARISSQKGILPLVSAWRDILCSETKCRLIIAGPDQGELEKIKPYFCANIEYIGPVYGEQKIDILKKSHYYFLPSSQEGFPTSVVEAMSYGAIPIISEKCNFPAIFIEKLGYKIMQDEILLKNFLSKFEMKFDFCLSQKNIEYVKKNLSEEKIADDLFMTYSRIIANDQ